MIKNYKLLLTVIASFMFPIACNEMSTKLSVSGVDKVPVGIICNAICVKQVAGGKDGVCVCTYPERNKPFCLTSTILTSELIVRTVNFILLEKLKSLSVLCEISRENIANLFNK